MSLECSECERDLRGGHSGGCSRHPVTKKRHPLYKAVATVRKELGLRDDHHAFCASRSVVGRACDCYAKRRNEAHEALDEIIEATDKEE